MHERIAKFPSKQFYEGKLITSESVKNRLLSPWESDCLFPTICFWDTKRGGPSGGGVQDFTNIDESDFIFRRIMAPFIRKYSGVSFADDPSNNLISIGIISFYKDQVKSLQQQWDNTPAFKAAKFKKSFLLFNSYVWIGRSIKIFPSPTLLIFIIIFLLSTWCSELSADEIRECPMKGPITVKN